MNTMTYRDYAARVEYDSEDKILVGHITGIRDRVGFHAESVTELEAAFQEAVKNYLSACGQLGQHPDKPVGGEIHLQVSPEVHQAVIRAAEESGKSLDQLALEVLGHAAGLLD